MNLELPRTVEKNQQGRVVREFTHEEARLAELISGGGEIIFRQPEGYGDIRIGRLRFGQTASERLLELEKKEMAVIVIPTLLVFGELVDNGDLPFTAAIRRSVVRARRLDQITLSRIPTMHFKFWQFIGRTTTISEEELEAVCSYTNEPKRIRFGPDFCVSLPHEEKAVNASFLIR